MKDDVISRQAAIDLVESFYKIYKSVLNIMVFKLKQLPSAQPEIIRCKECKHFWLGQCRLNGLTWSYDSFCSRAERWEE